MVSQKAFDEKLQSLIKGNKRAREAYLNWVDENDYQEYSNTLVPIAMQNIINRTRGPTILDVHAGLNDLRDSGWRP